MTKADTSMLIKNMYSYSVVKVFKFRKGKSSTPASDAVTCLVPIWSPTQVHLQSSYSHVCGSAQSKVSLNMQLTGTRLLLLMELINCFQRNLANFKKIGRFKYYLIYFDSSKYEIRQIRRINQIVSLFPRNTYQNTLYFRLKSLPKNRVDLSKSATLNDIRVCSLVTRLISNSQ